MSESKSVTIGRPSSFTPEIAERICHELTEGKSLREICRADDMPANSTVARWLISDEVFREQYTKAREIQAEFLADELVEIADDGTNDWMERQRKDGSTETILDAENINRSRLRVDTRKWVASKLLPKRYGDRLDLKHENDPINPMPGATLTSIELARELAFLLRQASEKSK